MGNLFKQFATNPSIEREGVLLEYGSTDDGKPIRIRVARAGGANIKFTRLMEAKTKPYRRQIQAGTVDRVVLERLAREVYAEAVVIGWENVQNEDGEPMVYSVPTCIALFEKLPDLYEDIVEQSTRMALFRAEILEEDSKN